MALYMIFHALPDSHIDFLSEHREAFRPYMEGRPPELRRSLLDRLLGRDVDPVVPDDWPCQVLEGVCPEVNHRQVEYFHYILNGTRDKVGHAGCVFQTWFAPRFETVVVTLDGENFALRSDEVPQLKARIEAVSEVEMLRRYEQVVGEPAASQADREFLREAFAQMLSACEQAISSGKGLMWTAG